MADGTQTQVFLFLIALGFLGIKSVEIFLTGRRTVAQAKQNTVQRESVDIAQVDLGNKAILKNIEDLTRVQTQNEILVQRYSKLEDSFATLSRENVSVLIKLTASEERARQTDANVAALTVEKTANQLKIKELSESVGDFTSARKLDQAKLEIYEARIAALEAEKIVSADKINRLETQVLALLTTIEALQKELTVFKDAESLRLVTSPVLIAPGPNPALVAVAPPEAVPVAPQEGSA